MATAATKKPKPAASKKPAPAAATSKPAAGKKPASAAATPKPAAEQEARARRGHAAHVPGMRQDIHEARRARRSPPTRARNRRHLPERTQSSHHQARHQGTNDGPCGNTCEQRRQRRRRPRRAPARALPRGDPAPPRHHRRRQRLAQPSRHARTPTLTPHPATSSPLTFTRPRRPGLLESDRDDRARAARRRRDPRQRLAHGRSALAVTVQACRVPVFGPHTLKATAVLQLVDGGARGQPTGFATSAGGLWVPRDA